MDIVETYLTQLAEVVAEMPRDQIWDVIYALVDAWQRRARVFLLGNGGSAATASHMAYALNKLTIVPGQPRGIGVIEAEPVNRDSIPRGQPRFKAIALTDNVPLMTAWGDDTAYENIFVEQLLNFLEPGDVVIGISPSGNSPNVLKALQVAREHGAVTVGFTGRDSGQLKHLVEHCICVPSDHVGQQEDAHMILDHVIATTLRQLIEEEAEARRGMERVWGEGVTWD